MRKTRLKSMSDKKRAALLDPAVRAKKLKVQRERQAISRSLRQNKQGRKTPKKAKKMDAAKAAAKFAREFHSAERVAWVKRRVCRGCWSLDFAVENHHTKGEGTSRKGHYSTIIPLCGPCHREWHDHGRATFEAKHKMNAALEAERTQDEWQKYSMGFAA